MKKHYIKAVVQLLLQGKDVAVVLENLSRVLKEKGHQQLHVQILQGVAVQLNQQQKNIASVITVANKEDAERQKEAIEAALRALGGSSADAVIAVDKTLIGGFVATYRGKSSDHSYKEKLVSLYRSITK